MNEEIFNESDFIFPPARMVSNLVLSVVSMPCFRSNKYGIRNVCCRVAPALLLSRIITWLDKLPSKNTDGDDNPFKSKTGNALPVSVIVPPGATLTDPPIAKTNNLVFDE